VDVVVLVAEVVGVALVDVVVLGIVVDPVVVPVVDASVQG
jgi:hypothetical protein